jgi:hypothetical protein
VQLPEDAAQDLPVVTPWLAAPAVGGQQRLHASKRSAGELNHPPSPDWCTSRNATLPTSSTSSSKVRLEY